MEEKVMIEEEFNYFLEDMKQNKTFCSYLDVWSYEDNYSYNQIEKEIEHIKNLEEYNSKLRKEQKEIEKCREKLEKMIIEWLKENKPNKYYMIGGFDTTYLIIKDELIKRNLDPTKYEIIQ